MQQQGAAPPDRSADFNGWFGAILHVAAYYRLEVSRENLRVSTAWEGRPDDIRAASSLARQARLSPKQVKTDIQYLTALRLPHVAQRHSGQLAVITAMSAGKVSLSFSGDGGLVSDLSLGALKDELPSLIVMRPTQSAPDSRVDDYIKPYAPN